MALYDFVGYRRRWQFLAYLERPKVSSLAPIVIGGCGNSGTTLLRATLNAHSEIASGPESTVFLSRVSSPTTIADRFGVPATAVETLLRRSRSQVEFIEQFADLCLRRHKKAVWADKTPENVSRLDFIFHHFPKARFVHVVRDGRDVACALRKQPWMKLSAAERNSAGGLRRCAQYWTKRTGVALKYRHDPRYCEVRYEDIVIQPEKTLRRLLTFLEAPWSDQMLDRTYVDANLVREEGTSPGHAGGPLFTNSIGRWRRELSAETMAEIMPYMAPMLTRLGYLDERPVGNPKARPVAAAGFGE